MLAWEGGYQWSEKKETWNKIFLHLFSTRYEFIQRGLFTAQDIGLVPTVYNRNQQLEAENVRLRKDLENYKLAAKYVIWS